MADNLVIPSASASEMYNFIMLKNANEHFDYFATSWYI